MKTELKERARKYKLIQHLITIKLYKKKPEEDVDNDKAVSLLSVGSVICSTDTPNMSTPKQFINNCWRHMHQKKWHQNLATRKYISFNIMKTSFIINHKDLSTPL